jgi:drug/metabolite transporter (DMT)-like permease
MSATTRTLLLSACFLWAISFVATKIALEVVPPLTVVSLRLIIASLCFVPLLMTGGRWRHLTHSKTLVRLFGLSLFGAGTHYGIQTIGLQLTTASNASLYVVTGPISILLLSVLFLDERLTRMKVFGVFVAIVGVLVVMGPDTLVELDLKGHVLGDLMVIISVVLWGCFTVFGKRLTDEIGALTVIAAVTVIGATWMTPIGLAEMHLKGFSLGQIHDAGWIAVLYLGMACNFLATLLYFMALQRAESQKVGVYLYTIPPMTAVAASLILHETITVNLVVGSILVIAGVLLTERG